MSGYLYFPSLKSLNIITLSISAAVMRNHVYNKKQQSQKENPNIEAASVHPSIQSISPHVEQHSVGKPLLVEKSDRRPFKKPQDTRTVTRYINYWKQFVYYCFRTDSLEPDRCQRIYGIEFTNEQEAPIH